MTELLLALSATSVFALLFILIPIIRIRSHAKVSSVGLSEEQKSIYQDKQYELDLDLTAGKINQADFEQAKNDLKLELAAALQKNIQASDLKTYKPFLLLPLVIILGSVAFYALQGKFQQIDHWQNVMARTSELGQKIVMSDGQGVTKEDLGDFYLALRTKLTTTPDDAVGWLLLGRVAASLNDFNAAILAYERSLALEPNKTSTMMSYVQALLASHAEGNVSKAKRWLQHIIQIEPSNLDALMMMGYVEKQSGNEALAIDYLQQALVQLPPNDNRALAIKELLAQKTGSKAEPTTTEATINSSLPQISVDLSQLAERGNEFNYLVVFARPTSSGPPFAVKRIELTPDYDFSKPVTLTDQDAMMANLNLSALNEVVVTVRFSFDADVKLTSGELEFNSEKQAFDKNNVLSIQFTNKD